MCCSPSTLVISPNSRPSHHIDLPEPDHISLDDAATTVVYVNPTGTIQLPADYEELEFVPPEDPSAYPSDASSDVDEKRPEVPRESEKLGSGNDAGYAGNVNLDLEKGAWEETRCSKKSRRWRIFGGILALTISAAAIVTNFYSGTAGRARNVSAAEAHWLVGPQRKSDCRGEQAEAQGMAGFTNDGHARNFDLWL